MTRQLANEYAAKIKALTTEHEANIEALYREFQAKAKANAEDLNRPDAGSRSPQNDQPN